MIRSRTSEQEQLEAHRLKIETLQKEIAVLKYTANKVRQEAAKLEYWTACMSYNDSYFGEPPGFLKAQVRQLTYAVQWP